MSEIHCMPLTKVTDGPLFSAGPGTLSALNNMRLVKGGYVEARGGFDKLKPVNGTSADAIAAGGFSDAIQTSTSYGWVRDFDGAAAVNSQYSSNRQLHEGGWNCFGAVPASGHALYFGADLPFSRIMVSLCQSLNSATFVVVYEYWDGGAWAALTTAETITWTSLRAPQYASWTMPTNWSYNVVGDTGSGKVLKYWMRIRISSITGLVTAPRAGAAKGYWTGMRELFIASQNPLGGANNGTFRRAGQISSTQEWFSISTSLYSPVTSPVRFAEYRGRVIMVNGKETKRYDGANFSDVGIELFIYLVGTHNLANVAAGALGAGIWRYYAAYGSGPCQNTDVYVDRQDVAALYGPGQAVYMTEVTTVAAERVRFEIQGAVPPPGTSSLYLYRTDDLTGMDANERPNAPAFLVQSFRIQSPTQFEQGLGGAGNYYYDDSKAYVSGPSSLTEARTYDIAPPARCKYVAIHQNRLLLGDDETWYFSDPFAPDAFSLKSTTGFIRLAKATGGKHMGGVEFADQMVLFTEDQTWGYTNIDLDIPQLFPIHPGVGSIAPDAIAVGEGVLIWPARDGFYLWDGSPRAPKKISDDMDQTFQKLSYESHGGSRAFIRNRMYTIRLASADKSTLGACWEYNLDTGGWNQMTPTGFSSTLFPLCLMYSPLDNNLDVGALHGLWGKAAFTASETDYSLYLDDLTTQDNLTNYTCSATMHFPLPPNATLTPSKLLAYYQAADGWGTPSLSNATANPLGSDPGTLTAGAPNTGTDYSLVQGSYSGVAATSDIKATFSVSSALGGTVMQQRFFGAVLKGKDGPMRRQFT